MTIDNLTAANNSIKIFSDSKVLKATEKEIISNIDKNLALNIYYLMLKVRRFEEKVGQLYSMGLIGGFCHLYIGQEGIISGIESLSSDDDCFITGYRCHAHMVSRGESLLNIFCELLAHGATKSFAASASSFDTPNIP